jgi:hypothetical protein
MTRLSVSIMAHPMREALVRKLVDRLGRDIDVSWDHSGPPSRDPERRWATGRTAWLTHDPTADWHLVLQDDALVSENLIPALESALDNVPPRVVVSPYLGFRPMPQRRQGEIVRIAEKYNASWIAQPALIWGVGIIAPTESVEDMIAWCNYKVGYNYDHRIAQYYEKVAWYRAWYMWPSVVDHRHRTPSLIGHGPDRYAQRMHGGSALDLDFGGPVVSLQAPSVQTIQEVWDDHVRVGG